MVGVVGVGVEGSGVVGLTVSFSPPVEGAGAVGVLPFSSVPGLVSSLVFPLGASGVFSSVLSPVVGSLGGLFSPLVGLVVSVFSSVVVPVVLSSFFSSSATGRSGLSLVLDICTFITPLK